MLDKVVLYNLERVAVVTHVEPSLDPVMLAWLLLRCACILHTILKRLVAAVLPHYHRAKLIESASSFVAAHGGIPDVYLDSDLFKHLVELGSRSLLLVDLVVLLDHVSGIHLSS